MRTKPIAREPVGPRALVHLTVVLLGTLIAGSGARAQQPSAPRLWAAQTGPNQVTLSWEEVPEAVEYRIYAGDPDATQDQASRRPISVLSGSGRWALITGIDRASKGLYLEAIGRDRRRRRKVRFNEITPVKGFQVVKAPAEVTATATGAEEITVSWTPVPGATAYAIGRAVSPNGLQMLCPLCPNQATYVDRDITPGADHSYTVAAVFPNGLSQRTASNIVTPGVVADAPPTQTPTTPYTPPGTPAGPTTPYTPPGTPAGPTTPYTPPGTPTGATTTTTPTTTTTTTHTATPITTTPPADTSVTMTTTNPLSGPLGRIGGILTGQTTTQTHTATPAYTGPCRLDYQRADNMWAAFGRPDGQLGTETISVLDGQTKLFLTDWKYEKLRNDGSNYYGSHLRIATNPGARPVKLQVRTGTEIFGGLASGPSTITLNASQTMQFRADLIQVSCTN